MSGATDITINISSLNMPLSTSPLGVFVLYTATDVSDPPDGKIETAADVSGTESQSTYFIMDTFGSAATTAEFLDDLDGLGDTDAHYGFTFTA